MPTPARIFVKKSLSLVFLVQLRSDSSNEGKARRRVFLGTWIAYAGYYFCRKNFSVAMPLLKSELGFSTDDLALILVCYNASYMLGQVGNGLASGRWGPKIVVGVGIACIIALNISMGMATSLPVFLGIGTLHGYAQSTGWPGTCQIMANWYPSTTRGVVMAWWSTNYVLGGFLATLFATWCITTPSLLPQLGWRRGFWFPAIVLVVIGVAFWRLTRSSPDASDEEQPIVLTSAPAHSQLPASPTTREELRTLLAKPALWIASAMYFFLKLTRYALLFWLPLYLTESLSYSTADAGYASSSFELFGIGGTLAAGYLSDGVFQSRRFPVSALMLFGLAIACLLQPHLASLGFAGMTAAVGIMGFMTYGPDSIMTGAAPMDMGNKRTAATAVGIINGFGSAGQLVSPLVVAWISTHYGWSTLFQFFVVCATVGGLLLLTQWKYRGTETELGKE